MDHTNAPTAVVTGARRGIGRGIAFALAEAGWRRLVLLDRAVSYTHLTLPTTPYV